MWKYTILVFRCFYPNTRYLPKCVLFEESQNPVCWGNEKSGWILYLFASDGTSRHHCVCVCVHVFFHFHDTSGYPHGACMWTYPQYVRTYSIIQTFITRVSRSKLPFLFVRHDLRTGKRERSQTWTGTYILCRIVQSFAFWKMDELYGERRLLVNCTVSLK